jgi:phosphoribosylformylglycinamidine (FGAM) synthase-like enzyme
MALNEPLRTIARLFAESNTRFVCEVEPAHAPAWEALLQAREVPFSRLGTVEASDRFTVDARDEHGSRRRWIDLPIGQLKAAWQQPLKWR